MFAGCADVEDRRFCAETFLYEGVAMYGVLVF